MISSGDGYYPVFNANGDSFLDSGFVDVSGAANLVLTGDACLIATSGTFSFQLRFYDSGGTLLLPTYNSPIKNASFGFQPDNTNRDFFAYQVARPTGAVKATVRCRWQTVVGAQIQAVRQIKLESGTLPATPYTLEGGLHTASAAISSEATARASADSALTTQVNQAISATSTNAAAIISEANTRASADSALATQVNTVATANATNAAAITSETTARTNADNALASSISSVQATANANTAAISSEATARANADSALSTSVSTLSSTVGGHTTSISTLQTSVNGISARWGVTINVNGFVTGRIHLDGTGSVSAFAVDVDAFYVGNSTSAGRPFSIVGGEIFFGGNAQSEGFTPGSEGWQITRGGDAEFNHVVVRNGKFFNDLLSPDIVQDDNGDGTYTITMSDPNGGHGNVIRYTDNGGPVRQDSPVYTEPFVRGGALLLRAVVDDDGHLSPENFALLVGGAVVAPGGD